MNVEELLRDGLQREADRTVYDPTPVEQVAWRARQVRRTQWAKRGGLALAATAAVSAPVALYGGALVAGPDPDRADPDRSLLAALPQGDAPTVDWLQGATYHGESGYDAPVDVGDVQAFVPFRGGLLLTTPSRVVVLDAGGSVVSEECGSPALGLDETGTVVVSSTVPDCDPALAGSGLAWAEVGGPGPGDDFLAMGDGSTYDAIGIRGDLTWWNWLEGDGSPRGVFQGATGLGKPYEVPGLVTATDLTPDGRWIAGVTRDGRDVVADAVTGEIRVELNGRAVSFSPDGQYVATVTDGALQVHDAATGEVLVAAGAEAGRITAELAWESSSQLVAVTEADGQEALVRITLDGSLDRASELAPPGSLVLVTQP